MQKYLLDANHLNVAFARTGTVRERVSALLERGSRVGTCVPVLCEVHAGLVFTKRREENYQLLDSYLQETIIFPVTRRTARVFGELFLELRQKGRQLSHVDITVAALARQLDATVVTTDRDFEALPDIKTENWLA